MKKNFAHPDKSILRALCFLCLVTMLAVIGAGDAFAAKKKSTKTSNASEKERYAAIVVDAQTGEVLMARHADSIRYPASLTKIMTLYMTFDAIAQGRLRFSDRITISSRAAKMSPSKLGLPVGSSIRVEDAIRALVTKSANDISVALAERIAGSEKNFAAKMTRKARELGMTRTTFRNASGLPDPQQTSTARDMAKLAIALLTDFPDRYHYFGIRNFEYNGVTHRNHNRLLGEYRGLDGIKTGFINASGFNLVASAKQNGRRLIGVVFGGKTWRSRNEHMVKLLDEGFATLATRPRMQEASVRNMTPPIPLPPPMREDFTPMVGQYTSDDAEEDGAYSPDDSQQITSIIETVKAQPFKKSVPDDSAPPLPVRRPDAPPVQLSRPEPVGSGAPTPPMAAAQTVMQLRIPRSQLPEGIHPSQIVSATSDNGNNWSIQVGAFQSRAMTDKALRTAQAKLPAHLQGGRPVIVPQSTGGAMIFRARIQGYSELQANSACAHLGACLVVSPGS